MTARRNRRRVNPRSPRNTGIRLIRQAQGIETLGVHPEAALGNELTKNGAPLGGVMLRAGAEHFQPVVAPVADACIVLTDEHVDQVGHAEAFAGAGDAGHGLLRSLGAVPGLRRVHAIIAIAAGLSRLFAEVGADGAAAAGGEFAQAHHGFQFLVLHPLMRLVGLRLGQPLTKDDDFPQAVIHPRAGRQAVAARTPRFLVIGFNALRQAEVGDKAHVGFVDAHAKRNRGDNHHTIFAQETLLMPAARVIRKTRVVGQRVTPTGAQPLGDLLHFFARQAIDDAGVRRDARFAESATGARARYRRRKMA